jgi:hypothetical protein
LLVLLSSCILYSLFLSLASLSFFTYPFHHLPFLTVSWSLSRPVLIFYPFFHVFLLYLLFVYYSVSGSQDVAVAVLKLDCRPGSQGIMLRVPASTRVFFFSKSQDRLWSPLSLLCNRFQGVKRPEHEAHNPRASVSKLSFMVFTGTLSHLSSLFISLKIRFISSYLSPCELLSLSRAYSVSAASYPINMKT